MPIYAYRCAACGHAQDVLQKMSDPLLTRCPVCGAEAFQKQVTAAGFQLKGSGWYVTDFRGGNSGGKEAKPAEGGDGKPATESKPDSKPDAAPAPKTEAKTEAKADSKAAAPAPSAPSPSPSSSSGG